MIYIGIDPGKNGGVAWIEDGEAEAQKLPATERDRWELIACLERASSGGLSGSLAMIEKVGASPQMGRTSAFNFGRIYGELRACLIASGIPFDEVTPAKWQRKLGCLTGGNKNISKAKAQELFPGMKITHAIADALLLAEYCKREHCWHMRDLYKV